MKWEYEQMCVRTDCDSGISFPDMNQLKEKGAEGWEVISLVPTENPAAFNSAEITHMLAFLKRSIE